MEDVQGDPDPAGKLGLDREVDQGDDGVIDEGQHPPADKSLVREEEVAVEGIEIKELSVAGEVVHDDHDG